MHSWLDAVGGSVGRPLLIQALEALAYLARAAAARPLVILGSYRDDERPDLPQQLPEMCLLPLSRLSQSDVAALSEAIDDRKGISISLNNLGHAVIEQGDYVRAGALVALGERTTAQAHYGESLTLAVEIGNKEGVAYNLAVLAMLAIERGAAERSVRLAAAKALLHAIDGVLHTRFSLQLASTVARALLGKAAFQLSQEAGRQMSYEEAVQYALQAA